MDLEAAAGTGHSLHEVSYRVCFKPQLPGFFIERLTRFGDVVYDPFMGCDTTPIKAALMGRRPFGSAINPLGGILVGPRLHPPDFSEITHRVSQIDWIRMVATNRLTGHSSDFLSVYTPPPNRVLSVKSQLKINRDRGQIPPDRDVAKVILRRGPLTSSKTGRGSMSLILSIERGCPFHTGTYEHTPEIKDDNVHLVVTSPPFLDVVNYQKDNWFRC